MMFVVGGASSGKRTFARQELAPTEGSTELDCAQIDATSLDGLPLGPKTLVLDAHALAPALLHRDADGAGWRVDEATVARMAELLAVCAAVTWAEQGWGIVPIDAHDRAAREAAGRLGCELAARADIVVRMTCGIPQVIKGTLPMGGSPCPRL